ncbi:MAG: hypothetical protein ACFFD8_10215 [Candidatus Thorarchaeota archaeon]
MAVMIIVFIFGLHLFIEYIRAHDVDRSLLMYALLMLWLYALGYGILGMRYIVVIPNATLPMLQGWDLLYAFSIGAAGFFGLFWIIRVSHPNFFKKRGRWVALLPILATVGYLTLAYLATITHPTLISLGFVTALAPNLTTYYGLGFTVLAFVNLVMYIGVRPIGLWFIYLRRRRSLGTKVMMKDLMVWIGLLLIFVTILLDTAMRFVPGSDFIVVYGRGLLAVGFFLFWFGYRLSKIIIR